MQLNYIANWCCIMWLRHVLRCNFTSEITIGFNLKSHSAWDIPSPTQLIRHIHLNDHLSKLFTVNHSINIQLGSQETLHISIKHPTIPIHLSGGKSRISQLSNRVVFIDTYRPSGLHDNRIWLVLIIRYHCFA